MAETICLSRYGETGLAALGATVCDRVWILLSSQGLTKSYCLLAPGNTDFVSPVAHDPVVLIYPVVSISILLDSWLYSRLLLRLLGQ